MWSSIFHFHSEIVSMQFLSKFEQQLNAMRNGTCKRILRLLIYSVVLLLLALAFYSYQPFYHHLYLATDDRATEMVRETSLPSVATSPISTNATTTTVAPSTRKPVILLWIPPYAQIKWFLPDTPICGGGCVITKDRSRYDESDAVVFFMKGTNTNSLPDPSTHNRQGKVYVWWCEESPWTVRHNYRHTLSEFNGYYNWTMHYKSDSDVLATLIPHSARDWMLRRMGRGDEAFNKTIEPGLSKEKFEASYELLRKEKNESAVIVISDCAATRGAAERMRFVKTMQNFYKVDMFGLCNGKPLPASNSVYHKTLRNYKFFFAFENGRACNEYITEKFWINSLYVGCVPVVWGPKRADVARLAPPNSFIHAEDFGYDPKRLAEYLKEVEANETLYKSFFSWWKEPDFYPVMNIREPADKRNAVSDEALGYQVSAHCHLCKKLKNNEHLRKTKVVENLAEQFYGKESSSCYT